MEPFETDRLKVGDLVIYQPKYTIPADSLRYKWIESKDKETPFINKLGVIVNIDDDLWKKRMYTTYDEAIYKVYWLKNASTSYVPAYNLKKATQHSANESEND